jgi:hypothetical protein
LAILPTAENEARGRKIKANDSKNLDPKFWVLKLLY